jgi:hypothetical protein
LATKLDSELLEQTLAYATESVPFYRAVRRSHPTNQPIQLADFPIIDKGIVSANFEQFLNLDRFPDFVISSGGTMENFGALSYRCQDEYEAVHYFFSGRDPRELFEANPTDGFALDVFNNTNGYFWRKPPRWPVLAVTLEQQTHADLIARLIRDGLPLKGRRSPVRHIQGQCAPMRTLTGYYASSGFQPRLHGPPTLLVYGSYMTRVWKQRFQEVWGNSPMEQYGLSEFSPGAALKCDHCDGFHFWTCWPEFLSLDSDESVMTGDARLLLTSLLPFARLQPRIRYFTGDIVTATPLCTETGKPGFRFRGRISSSIISCGVSTPTVLFSEREVREVIDQLPDIAHEVHVSERQIWETADVLKPDYQMGYPRFQLIVDQHSGKPPIANILIEVSFDWRSDLPRSHRLLDRVQELLREEVPSLDAELETRRLTLNVGLENNGGLRLRVKPSA